MRILIYYNLNHHNFKTIYNQNYTCPKVGSINKFNHMLIQIIRINEPPKPLKEKTADRLELLAERLRYGKKKVSHAEVIYKTRKQWWLR